MAKHTTIILVDDITGEDGTEENPVETVLFGLNGVDYEIDLSQDNAKGLRDGLALYIEKGRKIPSARRRSSAPTRRRSSKTSSIRAWARDNGYSVGDRGRIRPEIVKAWEDAGSPA